MNIREQTESFERLTLAPNWATFSSNSKGRKFMVEKDGIRTDFQRDRDRIIHCDAFRRLKQKTQVFLAPEGDMYRTRLTHTLEVAQISRTIARALRLNEDLTEAIALGHDLGHTPFGHAGEAALNKRCDTGFAHYKQSVRVVDFLANDGNGLNLTEEVRDGILNHTKGEWAHTPEGCVVRFGDQIAFLGHDIEDACRAGIMTNDDIPKEFSKILGNSKSERITTMVMNLIKNSSPEINEQCGIQMNKDVYSTFVELRQWMYDNVYTNQTAKAEESKVDKVINDLFEFYLKNPNKLPKMYQDIASDSGLNRAVTDYISGMTDGFAIRTYENLFVPHSWKVI